MLAAIAFVACQSSALPKAFPIAVWLQEPALATKYKAAGFNLYIGLWQGPTETQLAALKAANMPVICDQNEVGRKHLSDTTILGWMHGDEPDNAQEIKDPATGKQTYGPCVPPPQIVEDYWKIKTVDPSRPVMLNLGQGVANDAWKGRGNGAKLDDYKTYVQGCDIVSFDVYPVAGLGKPDQLGLVAKGVDRLRGWTNGSVHVWNCIECTNIGGKMKPSPAQVKAEAWSAIIHGSRGLIYFVHQFEPKFDEHALLDDPEMLQAVTVLNAQIQKYAPKLSGPSDDSISISGVESWATISGSDVYLFAVSLDSHPVKSAFRVPKGSRVVEIEEKRAVRGNTEQFAPYQFHVYRISR